MLARSWTGAAGAGAAGTKVAPPATAQPVPCLRLKWIPDMRRQSGFTMLEVLITMVIIAFGLLGVAGIIANGLKNNQGSYQRSQASWLASDIIDRMRANRHTAEDVAAPYNLAVDGGLDMSDVSNIPKLDLVTWRAALAAALPSGTGGVTVDAATRKVTVPIRWNDARAAGGATDQQFIVESRL
jgi:type IV pilus assembly protein PilV